MKIPRFFREFPSRLVEGTPDDIRKARFRQAWNTTGVAAKMDFESSDQDLLEDEPELEDGESADDTKDSVVRFLITFFWFSKLVSTDHLNSKHVFILVNMNLERFY